jgi:hypothetical protein
VPVSVDAIWKYDWATPCWSKSRRIRTSECGRLSMISCQPVPTRRGSPRQLKRAPGPLAGPLNSYTASGSRCAHGDQAAKLR